MESARSSCFCCILLMAATACAAPTSTPQTQPSADVRSADERDAPLFAAAVANDAAAATRALDAGVSPDAENRRGRTALIVAAKSGSLAVAKVLIARGADVNRGEGWSVPLNVAIDAGHNEIAELLLANGAKTSQPRYPVNALHVAAGSGNLEMVKRLVEMKMDLHEDEGCLGTPLHLAVENGYVEVADYLLKHGAAIEEMGRRVRVTPLIGAASCGNLAGVKFMLDRGANINARGWNKETALAIARKRHHDEVAKYLQEHGAAE